ncbi:hypothetical protein MD484_g546, partial [Candolleomyces efflorescens]
MSVDEDARTSHSRSNSASSNQRVSIDSQRGRDSPLPAAIVNGVNGHASSPNGKTTATAGVDDSEDLVERLQRELDKTKAEKDALASQYNNLLAKLTDMRTRLGTKLKQDAEELDRREQTIQSLTAQNDDLTTTIETLKEELVTSHDEAERSSKELDALRTRSLQESSHESLMRERELRETQLELERCRMERDEWERSAMHEKAISEDARTIADELRRDLELEREAKERDAGLLAAEQEKAENLQSVLQDFQAAKDHELRQAVKDYEGQLQQVTLSLAEFKHRAHTAELKLEESQSNITKTQELENQIKEKNLLIGKLRHETVIINEHLVEALRRLRKSSSETNVDRRLVTNVLLSFLNTPRGDTKRFEMLNLLASILGWGDQEKEKAGIQKAGGSGLSVATSPSGFWGRSLSSGSNSPSPLRSAEVDKSDETESFSRLWVEFLLTEANAAGGEGGSSSAQPPFRPGNSSLPNSPAVVTQALSPPTLSNNRRLVSLSAVSSTPDLTSLPSPLRKGKERDFSGGS